MKTARMVLERGGTVCIFPEGTRIRTGSLASPKRGVGRLALQTGAQVVPVAVHRQRGGPPRLADPPAQGAAADRPGDDLPPLRAPLAGAGGDRHLAHLAQRRAPVGGSRRPAADAPRGGDRSRELGHRGRRAARPGRARGAARDAHRRAGRADLRRAPEQPLPRGGHPAGLGPGQAGLRDRACRARPDLPRDPLLRAAAGRRRDRRPDRGPHRRCCCSARAWSRRRASSPPSTSRSGCGPRAIACLGGPAHSREAVSGSAALVLGSADADLRSQVGDVFDRAGLVCERSDDVVGVEMAGAAKNAAALAAAAAAPHGLNAAGIAAAEVWSECVDYAIHRGAKARDLHRARRGRRPDRDRPGARQPQPPGRRAARLRAQPGGDQGGDRPGLRGARLGSPDRRDDRRRRASTRARSAASRR